MQGVVQNLNAKMFLKRALDLMNTRIAKLEHFAVV